MINGKRSKLFALALAILVVFVLLIRHAGNYAWSLPVSVLILTEKAIIDSKNNEFVDEAINREISKDKTKEEAGVGAEKEDSGDAEEDTDATAYDPAKDFLMIRLLAPMTIFSKTYCPFLKRLKKLLAENYSITPAPQIVELDKHKHGQKLQEYVGRVTERRTVPNIIIGTASTLSKGGADDFIQLHETGQLADMLNLWGEKAISVTKLEVPSNS